MSFLSVYLSIISAKQYLCSRFEKNSKSINKLIRHLNSCKNRVTQIDLQQIQHKFHDKKKILDQDLEDKNQLVGKTDHIKKDVLDTLTKKTLQNKIFASESLLFLKKVYFIENEFHSSISISNIKFDHPRL